MKYKSPLLILLFSTSVVFASNCPTGDQLLNNNTPLSSLCPNGFTSALGGQSVGSAIQAQQTNAQEIVAAAEQAGVPPNLALAVSYQESHLNSCAGSPTGVKGPMQLTQSTARSLGYNRDINEQNIQGGMQVLKSAINACGTTNYACLSAHYNGSNPRQQAEWAAGVRAADAQLKNDPSLLASACSSSSGQNDCPQSPSQDTGTPAIASGDPLPSAASQPTLASSDIIVSPTQI